MTGLTMRIISVKILYVNNRNREKIIETGEDIKIRRQEEYKAYKGFLFGALTYAPYLLIMVIHAIVSGVSGSLVVGEIGATVYMMFYSLVGFAFQGSITAWVYYIAFYGMVIVSAVSGVGYLLGARKIFKQHEQIEKYNKSIYGK